jgi:hypothetical protein
MKNFKKLNRDELKSISGDGLLDPLGGLIGGVVGAVGGIVGGVVGGVANGVGGIVGNVVATVGNGLCQVQCEINNVIHIRLLNCGATTC